MAQNYRAQIQIPSSAQALVKDLPPYLKTWEPFAIAGTLAFLGALAWMGQSGKKRGATGRFGGRREKANAHRLAHQQMRSGEKNSVALYLGRRNPLVHLGKPPVYLPDAQRGTAVCGGPGSGKTFSVIDPAVRSAIDQGFPVILYDFKYPSQTARVAGYAGDKGYKVRVFAPGFPESDVCNPLDFLKDETDSLMARQMAEVLNKNFSMGSGNKSEDPFFTQAGDQLTEGIFLLAKSFKDHADLMTCQALLSLDKLPDRIRAQQGTMDSWIYASFGQLLSVGDAEETLASIVATATNNFTRFMKKDIVSAFCGKTTIPLDLKGKQMIVMGLDREKRDVVAPLLATVLHMIVSRNVTKKRSDPLILALDELPTLYLPALVQWLNENREDGLVTILGFQNMAQLEKTYGNELARSILGGCASKAIFNPQEQQSAEMFSEFLGEEEIRYTQKSRGSSSGKGSVNRSEERKTRRLFETSRFLKLKTGHCILVNPGYSNRDEAAVPIQQAVQLPRAELKAVKDSQEYWRGYRQGLRKLHQKRSAPTQDDLKNRYALADEFFKERKQTPMGERKLPFKLDKLPNLLVGITTVGAAT
jgi:type IV secretory pathway TraG/TraD family ATPase VirD4